MPSEAVVKVLACDILGLGTLCFYVHPLRAKPLPSAFDCFVTKPWLGL